jgi:cysteine synthase A
MPLFNNILETIGNTPLVRLQKLSPWGSSIYAKVESFNPLGSVKDRMAREVIEQAEKSGALKPGQTVIEATSGNTGIGLAMVCARKGYPLVVVMQESASIERRKIMRFLGAKVVLTPAAEKGTGMLAKAVELADKHGYFLARQFDNEANADAHEKTTAREILDDLGDEPIDYFVTGFGTGGTLLGVGRVLKRIRPGTKIIAAEPDNSPVLGSGIPQACDAAGKPSASHPSFRPHLMQGWGPDFISNLTQQALDRGLIDEVVPVSGDDAMEMSKSLAQEEGIFVGTSSGATLAAAIDVAKRAKPGSNIVCMLPDTGERYMSTPLFDDISEDMNQEEIALSESTPGYRFSQSCDIPSPTLVPDVSELDEEAVDFVEEVVRNEPVVMFALEWCEFSWSVRKLFQHLGIEYHSVDLDSIAYQARDFGGKIRAALRQRVGSPTIPQVFIGGRHVGGASDLFDAMRDGTAQELLRDAGVRFRTDDKLDPYALLPQWIQPRKTA